MSESLRPDSTIENTSVRDEIYRLFMTDLEDLLEIINPTQHNDGAPIDFDSTLESFTKLAGRYNELDSVASGSPIDTTSTSGISVIAMFDMPRHMDSAVNKRASSGGPVVVVEIGSGLSDSPLVLGSVTERMGVKSTDYQVFAIDPLFGELGNDIEDSHSPISWLRAHFEQIVIRKIRRRVENHAVGLEVLTEEALIAGYSAFRMVANEALREMYEIGAKEYAISAGNVLADAKSDTPRVQYLAGVSDSLPLQEDSADIAYCSNLLSSFAGLNDGIEHEDLVRRSIFEMMRIVRSGGTALVGPFSFHDKDTIAKVIRLFEEAKNMKIDLEGNKQLALPRDKCRYSKISRRDVPRFGVGIIESHAGGALPQIQYLELSVGR